MNNWQRNKAKARTITTKPTLTDQSAADETNLNVIVGKMFTSGTAPGAAGTPMFGDFTELPWGLRAMIEHSRGIDKLREDLPAELRALTPADLLRLTPQELKSMLAKPDPEPTAGSGKDQPKGEPNA